jgi:hypothetical protein
VGNTRNHHLLRSRDTLLKQVRLRPGCRARLHCPR